MRDTNYATERATADIDGCRIERIYVKDMDRDEIRFSWWVDGKLQPRPLDLPETELLPLLCEAIKAGVFENWFLRELHCTLYDLKPRDDEIPGSDG
jgi:hypothetical protein